jgi:hypothetical protein
MNADYVLIRDKRVNFLNVDYYESYNYVSTIDEQIVYTIRIMYNCGEKHTLNFPTEAIRDRFIQALDILLGVTTVTI